MPWNSKLTRCLKSYSERFLLQKYTFLNKTTYILPSCSPISLFARLIIVENTLPYIAAYLEEKFLQIISSLINCFTEYYSIIYFIILYLNFIK